MESLKHENYLQSIAGNMKNYRNNSEFCDVILSVGGIEYSAHKLILCSSSPFFATMFNGHFPDNDKKTVALPGFEPKPFEEILNYMYSGELQLNSQNVRPIFKAADFLQMSWLREQCHEFFKDMIDDENCVSLWKMAELYDLEDILMEAEKQIVGNIEIISETSDFLALSFNDIKKLLESSDLSQQYNESIFTVVMRWIKSDLEQRADYLQALLSLIHTNSISQIFLDQVIVKEDILRNNTVGTNWLLDNFSLMQTYQPILGAPSCNLMAGGVEDRHIYVVDNNNNYFHSYNVETRNLNRLANRPPSQGFSMVVYNGDIYVVGGKRTRTALKYSLEDDFWQTVAIRCYGSACGTCVLNDSIYFTGGYMDYRVRSSVKRYDFLRGKLEQQPRMLVTRAFHGSVAHRNCIYACGGTSLGGPEGFVYISLSERMDTREGMWRLLPTMHNQHGHCSTAIVSDAIYCSSTYGGITERFDVRRCNWEPVGTAPGEIGSIVAYEDELYQVHAGGIAMYCKQSDSWRTLANYSFDFPIATSFYS